MDAIPLLKEWESQQFIQQIRLELSKLAHMLHSFGASFQQHLKQFVISSPLLPLFPSPSHASFVYSQIQGSGTALQGWGSNSLVWNGM
jgi:hypothetical protein